VAIVASGRQTNEELYLLSLLAKHLGALTDAPPRTGQGDGWLRVPDQNPNSNGAELLGLAANPPGSRLPRLLEAVATGQVKTLLVFGEDLAKHGFSPALLGRLEMLVLSDILPNPTAEQAHYLLPGCAHTEKAGTFINCAGRVQRFFKAVEPPGQARPEAEFLTELVGGVTGTELPGSVAAMFNRLANDIPAMQGMKWETLGAAGADLGAEALSRKA
jgi:predicted molibdopterin-dependent oxidoreductase YjgC